MQPLKTKNIVLLANNIPGPSACKRLLEFGASVTKVESPKGDPLKKFFPKYYSELCKGFQVEQILLSEDSGQKKMDQLLTEADLFITSQKRSSLVRLNLFGTEFLDKFENLKHIEITGFRPPFESWPGHDLNFQGRHGLIEGISLPTTLLSDLLASEIIVSNSLAMLLSPSDSTRFLNVPLEEGAIACEAPLRHGLTTKTGILGGNNIWYNIYPTKSGNVAFCPMEPHLRELFQSHFPEIENWDEETITLLMKKKTASEWEIWAQQNHLPISTCKETL